MTVLPARFLAQDGKHWGGLKSWKEVWMMVPRENTKLENTKLEIPFVVKKIEFQIKRVNFYLRRR